MMGRRKTSSKAYENAIRRMAAVQSIDPNFDLGNNLTYDEYQNLISNVKLALDNYNTTLSLVDEKFNTLKALEARLRDMNERILTGVASKYGKNSSEYEQSGGRRKSEIRRKPGKKNG